MISLPDYLQLLPKTELHCHLTSTIRAATLHELATRYGVPLWTDDIQRLFDFADLVDFLRGWRVAHEVLRTPDDIARVAWEGVEDAVPDGNLRYREYYVNPQYFAHHATPLSYTEVVDAVIAGLSRAERDFGVGFRVVVAINRRESAEAAVDLVREMIAHPRPEVVGIGQDDLTPENTEDPLRFADAYALAGAHGLRRTAHVGETPTASPENVRTAIEVLGCDRIDHGYRVVDDPSILALAQERGIGFATTPWSTTICSGWTLDESHRIRTMVDAGLPVSVSTDDALFFRTDLGREYREGLTALGLDAEDAKRIALAGIDMAFCSESDKQRLRADFRAAFLVLDALLER
ncbi:MULTISPECIES: adenosine deaminase [Microbacterium]|uniref:adenosine deaminase n=1 Tax=Microbacterium TaxID=33882 RepID=UPI002782D365|nr:MULTISPECIES: adenosine deaminase [Microbacterium]MDQ1082760.1 adenosine deaminase [Microbacterium sp. SORGH_AS_0344]MDQ1168470.1 adenosine deaminase [Microbacterium proteolyticum]